MANGETRRAVVGFLASLLPGAATVAALPTSPSAGEPSRQRSWGDRRLLGLGSVALGPGWGSENPYDGELDLVIPYGVFNIQRFIFSYDAGAQGSIQVTGVELDGQAVSLFEGLVSADSYGALSSAPSFWLPVRKGQ